MNDLALAGTGSGSVIYAVLRKSSDDTVVARTSDSTFVTYVTANHATYKIAMPETPAGSNYFLANLPTFCDGISWNVTYYKQAGGTAAASDLVVGSQLLSVAGYNASTASADLITDEELLNAYSTTSSSLKRAFLISVASRMIEKKCDFRLVQEDLTEYLDGPGANFLKLGARPSSVDTVTYDPESDFPIEVTGTNFAWTDRGLLYVLPNSQEATWFPPGFRNIKVEYTSYGVVEDDLKMACIFVVKALDAVVSDNYWLTEKSVRDVKMKWAIPGTLDDPLFFEANKILEPYVMPVVL